MNAVYAIPFLCLSFVYINSAPSQDLSLGLEGYWSMDEGSGLTVSDVSGNNRHADAIFGEPAWVDGIKDNGLSFDGDDGLEVNWGGISGDTSRTISAWINTTAGNPEAYIGWGDEGFDGGKWHLLIRNTGLLRTAISGSNINGTTSLNDGNWHHIVVVLVTDGFLVEDVLHYIDGELEEVEYGNTEVIIDTVTTTSENPINVRIGSRRQTSDRFFIGTVDEVRIYSRELFANEIQALYANDQSNIPDWDLFD